MELFYWCGKPSEDPHCLAILVYIQVTKADVKLTACSHTRQSPSGRLPCLLSGSENIHGLECILAHLRSKGHNADYDLSRVQTTECVSVLALLQQKLHSTLLYMLWCEEDNFSAYTYKWYGKTVSFPHNFWYASLQQRHVRACLAALYGVSDLSLIKETAYSQARECLNLLAGRLDGQKFFFGDKPSSLDATIYAYIALLQDTPLAQNQLNTHIRACPPLVAFKEHMQRQFADKIASSVREPTFGDGESFLQRVRRKDWWWDNHVNLASVVFAGTVMLAYAASRGILWRSSG